MQVFGRLSHRKVVEVVAAILRSGTGNFTSPYSATKRKVSRISASMSWRLQVTFHQQILVRQPMGAPIDNLCPATAGHYAVWWCSKMFDSMQSTLSQGRLTVGLFIRMSKVTVSPVHFILVDT